MGIGIAAIGCRGQLGLAAPPVRVEVHLGAGLPTFGIVGLPAAAVRESRDRVRSALASSGFEFPAGRITVSLAPADLPKQGGRFDLPIALGILLASGQLLPCETGTRILRQGEFYGELSLNGDLLPVRGLVPAAAQAVREQRAVVMPRANLAEARVVRHPEAYGAGSLREVFEWLRGAASQTAGADGLAKASATGPAAGLMARSTAMGPVARSTAATLSAGDAWRPGAGTARADLSEVRGQLGPKRALLIAAAGAHSLLLCGPPGSGKTMLAERLPALLPPLSDDESLEVAAIASVSPGGFDPRSFGARPFRAPHHSSSGPAMVGGGSFARPGEVSLAHHGVLFLDELPEFDHRVLECLREPLENGNVLVTRARAQARYPAQFQLLATMNPCPCGWLGDAGGACRCTPGQVEAYRAKISGPLLDRIDLFAEVSRVPVQELAAPLVESAAAAAGIGAGRGAVAGAAGRAAFTTLCSADAARAVAAARDRQQRRGGCLNSRLAGRQLEACARPSPAAQELLLAAFEQLRMTARSWHRVLRVARTIADLDDSDGIESPHAAEAVQLRRGAFGRVV